MVACTTMASAGVFTIGLQVGHKDLPWCPPVVATPVIMEQISAGMREETVENLGVITPHFETDDVPNAPRQRDLC